MQKSKSLTIADDVVQNTAIQVFSCQEHIYIIPDPTKTGGLKKQLKIWRKTKVIQQSINFQKPITAETYEFEVFLGIMEILHYQFLVFVDKSDQIGEILNHKIYRVNSLSFLQIDNFDIIKEVKEYIKEIQKIFSKCHYYSYTYPLTIRFDKFVKQMDLQKQNFQNQFKNEEESKEQQKSNQMNKKEENLANQFKEKSNKNLYQKEDLFHNLCDLKFQWNFNMSSNYLINVDPRWNVQLIQGFVDFHQGKIAEQQIQLLLITRRSIFRSGTRFTHRGVDSFGNVANFCETEQIIINEQRQILTSYVIIRGSVPLMWEQKGSGGQILRMSAGIEMSKKAFLLHFEAMKQEYGQLQCYNLMKQFNKNESFLTKQFEQQIEENKENLKGIEYKFYDFAKNKKNLNQDMSKYRGKLIQDQEYFAYDIKNQKILNQQKNVLRVNCKDCLDRTNTFMMKMSVNSFENVLQKQFGINLEKEVQGNPLEKMDENSPHPYLKKFKYLWAEQGDQLSLIYAGSDATTTKLTKNGYKGFTNKLSHKITSLSIAFTRVIKSKFNDHYKQECLDLFLGQHYSSTSNTKINEQLQSIIEQSKVLKQKNVRTMFMSYNVEGIDIQKELNIQLQSNNSSSSNGSNNSNNFTKINQSNKFQPHNQKQQTSQINFFDNNNPFKNFFDFQNVKHKLPNILAVGLQQITEYSMFSPFKTHDQISVNLWEDVILKNLEKQVGKDKYIVVDKFDMLGNLLIVLVLKEEILNISDIFHDSIKCGFFNKGTEYGSVLIHFKYYEKDFCFININLPWGDLNKKLEVIDQIHQVSFQKQGVGKYKKFKLDNNDFIVMFGDFNSKLKLKPIEITQLVLQAKETPQKHIRKQAIQELQNYDELKIHLQKLNKKYSDFNNYHEPAINHTPNFRGSQSKSQPPSWKSRTFLKIKNQSKDEIKLKEQDFFYYEISQKCQKIKNSHKPLGTEIKIKLQVIDQQKSNENLQKLLEINRKKQQELYQEQHMSVESCDTDDDMDDELSYQYNVYNNKKHFKSYFDIHSKSNTTLLDLP